MMRALFGLILVLGLTSPARSQCPVAGDTSATTCADVAGVVHLKFKTHRRWSIKLPAETFSPVGQGFQFQASLGRNFKVGLEGTGLRVDSDGDGRLDVKAEGAQAVLVLQGQHTPYAVRLVNKSGWTYAAAGSMQGKLDGTAVQLIDQNNNGSYADVGQDAMIVGRGKTACFLSRIINIKGKLYAIEVARDGTSLKYSPYNGAAGSLSLARCETQAKVLGAVVKSVDGSLSFDLARARNGLLVPAGSYLIHSGEMGLGDIRVKIRTGRSTPLVVPADGTTEVVWGGPVRAEFAYARLGTQLQLSPDDIWYFGKKGEEYYDWFPNGKSPTINIKSHKTGREIAQAYFPGSC